MRLITILANSAVGEVLPAIAQLRLPDWWVAGGAVRNTVWRSRYGQQCNLGINDIDIAFFDAEGDRAQELKAKTALTSQFPQYVFDVKNQASFARWRDGYRVFSSTEDGISHWLHTATAVGVRLDADGRWQCFTPHGLDDLFNGVVRPTPTHLENPKAIQKAASFLENCPALVLGDDGSAG